jgi:hypothetical protein
MRILALVAFLIAAPAPATEVYRWVDKDGQAHFSDQWRPGAERIRIQESAVFSAPRPAQRAGTGGAAGSAPPAGAYQALEIASPAQEEVLWNTAGQLRVSVQVNPSLQPGHGLRLFLDGTPREVPAGSTSVELTDVFRGVHTLKAEVVDEKGKILIASQPRTFVVRQTSVANPQRPNAP